MSPLVLSTFTGAGLLDRGFREAGFCVVSAGDAQFGQPIEEFRAVPGVFAGVMGGPPCQRISRANRTNRDPSAGLVLVREFFRVVGEALPEWFLMENVDGTPAAEVEKLAPLGYTIQRLHLNPRELGFEQHRPRWFFFGYAHGEPLVIHYTSAPSTAEACCLASEGKAMNRRAWNRFCHLQGLPDGFDFPEGLSTQLRYRLVGNGVHVGVAAIIARAIQDRPQGRLGLKTPPTIRVCVCGCGRRVPAGRLHATVTCRQRTSRARRSDRTSVTSPGNVTPELALE